MGLSFTIAVALTQLSVPQAHTLILLIIAVLLAHLLALAASMNLPA